MGETKQKSKKWVVLLVVIVVVSIIIIARTLIVKESEKPNRLNDNEFNQGSGISFTQVNSVQADNLVKLGKIWGINKYYHPMVTSGEINWDAELFRVMPQVLKAEDSQSANKAIYQWLSQFPITKTDDEIIPTPGEVYLRPQLEWTEDESLLGGELSEYLNQLKQVKVGDSSKGYLTFGENDLRANLDNELEYSGVDFSDTGMRVLGLFRYWNIIEYVYPYKDIIDYNWDEILVKMLPEFISGDDRLSYLLAVSELSSFIQDSHADVGDITGELHDYFGKNSPPVDFLNIDGEIVITHINDEKEIPNELRIGDVIKEVNGVPISQRLEHCLKYTSHSNEDRFSLKLRNLLLATSDETVDLKVERQGEQINITQQCYEFQPRLFGQEDSGLILDNQIGYLNPGKLQRGEIDKIMIDFIDTKGIIVDLRSYPSDFIVFSLAEYINPEMTPFAKFSYCNQSVPGEFMIGNELSSGRGAMAHMKLFYKEKDPYNGKVILLINEWTQSQGEYTTMSLRKAPNAIVLGTPTIGADGDVLVFSLPFGVTTSITGLGVFYPDGEQTQRIGIQPDIEFSPTVAGIAQGKDELIDKGIQLILED